MFIEIFLTLFYTILLLYFIRKMPFFSLPGIRPEAVTGVFVLKICFGILVWLLYTFYYTDRSTADIYKYFDDSAVFMKAFKENKSVFFKMLLNLDSNNPETVHYYKQLNYWSTEKWSFFYQGNSFIILFNVLIRFFSFGHFNVHTVFMCFVSFVGLTGIYRFFEHALQKEKKLLFAAIFLLPSVLFWGSGVLKEGLILFGIGMTLFSLQTIYSMLRENKKKSPVIYLFFFICLLAIYITAISKFYILLSLGVSLIALAITRFTKPRFSLLKFAATWTVFFILIANIQLLIPQINALKLIATKQKDFINLANGGVYLVNQNNNNNIVYLNNDQRRCMDYVYSDSTMVRIKAGTNYMYWNDWYLKDTLYTENSQDTNRYEILHNIQPSGSKINIPRLQANWKSFLMNIPTALYNAVLRPFPGESFSPLVLSASLENFFLLLTFIICVIYHKPKARIAWPTVYLCISFILLLCIIIGLTTPIVGAMVRYKMPILPFIMIAALLIVDVEKLAKKFPKLNKIISTA